MKTYASRIGGVLAVVLLLAAPGIARAAAGKSIGDASELTGSASGTLPTALTDDWYVIYPSSTADSVTVTISNTTGGDPGAPCSLVIARVTDSSGHALDSQDLVAGDTKMFSHVGQDRYFVELRNNNCNPATDAAPTYTVSATGGSGSSLKGPLADAQVGGSIGDARTGLDGHVAYKGSIASASIQQWLVLASGSTSPLAIRVENTTQVNAANCNLLVAHLTDTFGRVLDSQDVAENTAYTFSVNQPGRYFLSMQDGGCDPPVDAPVTYDVQLDPTSAVGTPPLYPQQALQGGISETQPAGPVAGGIDYTDTVPDATTTKWYAIRVDGTAYLTVENTSPFRAPCGPAIVRVFDSTGTGGVGSQDLADDTGYTFDLSAGTYYLGVSDNNCDPETGSPLSFQFNVTPASAAVPGPGFGGPPPPTCQDAGAATTPGKSVTLQLSCSGGTPPLSYQVLRQPLNGQVSVNPQTGAATYTPRAGYSGTDSFTFNVGDATGVQAAGATATITVALATGVSKTQPGSGGGSSAKKPTGKQGKKPNYKAILKLLNRDIPDLKKEIAELDKIKRDYHLFVTGYEKLTKFILPLVKKDPSVARFLKVLREAADLYLLDSRDYVDQVDARAHQVLKAFTALRNAIDNPRGKNLAKLYRNATRIDRGGASEATKLKQKYRGFQRAINLLTDELKNDPAIRNNPILTGGVKALQKYMEDALKKLEAAEKNQSQLAAGERQVAKGG